MSHIWRKLLKKPNSSYKTMKKEIKYLHNYHLAELKDDNYEEAATALLIAVQLFYYLIMCHPKHPKRLKLMRSALDMLEEKMILDGYIMLKRYQEEEDEPPSFDKPALKPIEVKMPDKELQETYQNFKHLITFPTDTSAELWNDIVGLEDVKQWFLNALAGPITFKNGMNYLDVCNGVLLYGPPGTGKSMIARSLASKIKITFIEVQGSHLMSKWHGESEQNIRKFFAMAAFFSPCIVFIGK